MNFWLLLISLMIHIMFHHWYCSSSVTSFFLYFTCQSLFLLVSLTVTHHARERNPTICVFIVSWYWWCIKFPIRRSILFNLLPSNPPWNKCEKWMVKQESCCCSVTFVNCFVIDTGILLLPSYPRVLRMWQCWKWWLTMMRIATPLNDNDSDDNVATGLRQRSAVWHICSQHSPSAGCAELTGHSNLPSFTVSQCNRITSAPSLASSAPTHYLQTGCRHLQDQNNVYSNLPVSLDPWL